MYKFINLYPTVLFKIGLSMTHNFNTLTRITPQRYGDHRGYFGETYSRRRYAEMGIDVEFVQDNHWLSHAVGTLRGLHFQAPPAAQGKLVRCGHGAIFDVAVDIRRGSPTYGQWEGYELTAENGHQLYVPVGFAHGFVTLEPDPDGAVGEFHQPETHLIPLILDAIDGKRDALTIFGTDYDTPDGTCIRDYVYVCDLVDAHFWG